MVGIQIACSITCFLFSVATMSHKYTYTTTSYELNSQRASISQFENFQHSVGNFVQRITHVLVYCGAHVTVY